MSCQTQAQKKEDFKIQKTDAEWKMKLTEMTILCVLRRY